MRRIPYILSGLAVVALLIGCDAFRYHKKAEIVVADWFGLVAGEKKASSMSTMHTGLTFTSADTVQACWIEEIDEDLPAYIRDIDIDSVYCEITNKDTSRSADFALYVSEDSIPCEDLSAARKAEVLNSVVKIAAIHLESAEQIIINGQNFTEYLSNLESLVEIIKDGHFWAYAVASGSLHVHVEVSTYTLFVEFTGGLF